MNIVFTTTIAALWLITRGLAAHSLGAFRVEIDLVASSDNVVCSRNEKKRLGDLIEESIQQVSKSLDGSGSLCKVPKESLLEQGSHTTKYTATSQLYRFKVFEYFGGMRCRRCRPEARSDRKRPRSNRFSRRLGKCFRWQKPISKKLVPSKKRNKQWFTFKHNVQPGKGLKLSFDFPKSHRDAWKGQRFKVLINHKYPIDLGPVDNIFNERRRRSSSKEKYPATVQWTTRKLKEPETFPLFRTSIEIPSKFNTKSSLIFQMSFGETRPQIQFISLSQSCPPVSGGNSKTVSPPGSKSATPHSESNNRQVQARVKRLLLDYLRRNLRDAIKPGHCMYRDGDSIVHPEIKVTPKPGWENGLPNFSCKKQPRE